MIKKMSNRKSKIPNVSVFSLNSTIRRNTNTDKGKNLTNHSPAPSITLTSGKLIVIFKQLYSVIDTVKYIDPPDSDISIA